MFKKYISNYYVNEKGKVKNINTGKLYKGIKDRKGYLRLDISINGKRQYFYIHRAVAETFIPNPKNKPYVNHINGIKTDNRAKNLEWVTSKENTQHAVRIGLINAQTQGGKKCVQLDLKGNILKTFNCVSEAARYIKKSNSHICNCCNGKRKTAYGYRWKYMVD